MPTANPRITITLEPQVHALLKRLSELTGNSQSFLVGNLLLESVPVFERMAKLLQAAHRLQAESTESQARIKDSLVDAQSKLERQLGLTLESWDEVSTPLLDQAEEVGRRGRARSRTGRPTSTPLSNRGVTPLPKGTGKARTTARKGKR